MKMEVLDEIFRRVLSSKIFTNRSSLRPDYVPDELPHRENQIKMLGSILAQALRGSRPSNVFIYGLTGTGKTAVTKYVLKRIEEKSLGFKTNFTYAYINCRQSDTPYRVLADLNESIGVRVPFTGLSRAEVYRRFLRNLDARKCVMIIVLDEIDFLVKRHGDDILYKLSRVNEDLLYSQASLIGITNDLKLTETLDPRIKSSLGEEELVFPPYNAVQLEDILRRRAKRAFRRGVLEPGVIPLCAALAAKEHGDARRALDLLRVAGEIAEREGAENVTEEHVKKARAEIERDRVVEVLRTMPLHAKLVLLSMVYLDNKGKTRTTTGELYASYVHICRELGVESLTQRRISDLVNELDMLGLLAARLVSRGRYGRTKIIELSVSKKTILEVLGKDERFSGVANL